MARRVKALEDIYLVACALLFYLAGGAMKEVTVGLGYLACFLFVPSYPLLVVGVRLVKKTTLFSMSLVSALLVFVVQFVLEEGRLLDMCILFLISYFASKPFRFFLVSLFVYE